MNYLITGGAGFIGSNIAQRLVADGQKVRILDNFSSGTRENLAAFADKIELIEGDIRDRETVSRAVKGIDFVAHQAAMASVPKSVEDPVTANHVNLDGTLNVMEAARAAGVKRMVLASSAAVYGESAELPKRETMAPEPLSPYAVAKLTNEYYARVYWNLYRFPCTCLRYFNVFGPRQDPNSDYAAVIPRFISRLVGNKRPTVYGDGEQTRDFVYIDDVVAANLLALSNDRMVGEAFNVARGEELTLNRLLGLLKDIVGTDIAPVHENARPGDIRKSYADITRIRSMGFDPEVSLRDGLKKTVEYFASRASK